MKALQSQVKALEAALEAWNEVSRLQIEAVLRKKYSTALSSELDRRAERPSPTDFLAVCDALTSEAMANLAAVAQGDETGWVAIARNGITLKWDPTRVKFGQAGATSGTLNLTPEQLAAIVAEATREAMAGDGGSELLVEHLGPLPGKPASDRTRITKRRLPAA